MRYSSSFNPEIYSAAHRLVKVINEPQCIDIPALIGPSKHVQTTFDVNIGVGIFLGGGQFNTQRGFLRAYYFT